MRSHYGHNFAKFLSSRSCCGGAKQPEEFVVQSDLQDLQHEVESMVHGRVPVSCPQGFGGRYTVRTGDTMFLIAQRYRVSLDALIAANPQISNPAQLFPGDVLCVPIEGLENRVPVSCPQGFGGRYTVRTGDTMFLIAQRYRVSLDALIAANPHISNPAELFPGDVLCVPSQLLQGRVPTTCPIGFGGRYTVQLGDTMFLIAQRYRITLSALIAANPQITNPAEIFPGDVLCVPPRPLEGRVPVGCPPGFTGRYTVVAGDTMFLIARRFGVTLQALIAANPHIINPNELYPGDVLCVPSGVGAPQGRVPTSCPPGYTGRYTVVSGDTMFLIAQRYGITLQQLINANPHIANPNILNPGDVLCVPGGRRPASCPSGFSGRYVVVPGDTMFLIAQRYRITLQQLINANPHITNPNILNPGDVLCVPFSSLTQVENEEQCKIKKLLENYKYGLR